MKIEKIIHSGEQISKSQMVELCGGAGAMDNVNKAVITCSCGGSGDNTNKGLGALARDRFKSHLSLNRLLSQVHQILVILNPIQAWARLS